MPTIKRFEDLEGWKLVRELCSKLGQLIDNDTFTKNFRFIAQMEGSSGSIMDNIAEGFERGSKAEFLVFLGYSKGSCGELRSQLYSALDRKYISNEQFQELHLLAVRISEILQKLLPTSRTQTFRASERSTPNH